MILNGVNQLSFHIAYEVDRRPGIGQRTGVVLYSGAAAQVTQNHDRHAVCLVGL
jgi:hypothetical protein